MIQAWFALSWYDVTCSRLEPKLLRTDPGFCILDFDLDFDLIFDLESDLNFDLNFELDFGLNFDLDFDLNFDLDFELNFDLDFDLNFDLDFDWRCDLNFDLDFDLVRMTQSRGVKRCFVVLGVVGPCVCRFALICFVLL